VLHDVNSALSIWGIRIERVWRQPLVVVDESVCNFYDSARTPTTFVQQFIVGIHMSLGILHDALRIGMPEAVEGDTKALLCRLR
jgi:hypothetical protein